MLSVSGCSTMTPARYTVSVEKNMVLKSFQGSAMEFIPIGARAKYDASCRMMGPIQASDGKTITEFVRKTFNDKFKFSGVYGESGAALTGRLDNIQFSSSAGLTNGWWDLALTMSPANGHSISIEKTYKFKSGFDAITACNRAAQALGATVQDLIKKTVADRRFKSLLRKVG